MMMMTAIMLMLIVMMIVVNDCGASHVWKLSLGVAHHKEIAAL